MGERFQDLISFSKSQGVIADAVGSLLPHPKQGETRQKWEQAARLILQIAQKNRSQIGEAELNMIEMLRATFNAANSPKAKDDNDVALFMTYIKSWRREPHIYVAPPCVFLFDGAAYVHQPILRMWLSLPAGCNRWYDVGAMRNALRALGFETHPDFARRHKGKLVRLDLWKGPSEVLGVEEE